MWNVDAVIRRVLTTFYFMFLIFAKKIKKQKKCLLHISSMIFCSCIICVLYEIPPISYYIAIIHSTQMKENQLKWRSKREKKKNEEEKNLEKYGKMSHETWMAFKWKSLYFVEVFIFVSWCFISCLTFLVSVSFVSSFV